MPPEFDIQQHLEAMETRIRGDISELREDAKATAEKAANLDGRVKNLEEKAGWIGAGFGGTVAALAGFAWHILTSGSSK